MFVAMMQLDLLQGDSFIIQRPYRGGGGQQYLCAAVAITSWMHVC